MPLANHSFKPLRIHWRPLAGGKQQTARTKLQTNGKRQTANNKQHLTVIEYLPFAIFCLLFVCSLPFAVCSFRCLAAQDQDGAAPQPKKPLDYFEGLYQDYWPAFLPKGGDWMPNSWLRASSPVDKESFENTFSSFVLLNEDTRANAMVKAAIQREMNGEVKEALQLYQQVLDVYPDLDRKSVV